MHQNSGTGYQFLLEMPLHCMSLKQNSKPFFFLWLLIVVNCAVSCLFIAVIHVVYGVNVYDI